MRWLAPLRQLQLATGLSPSSFITNRIGLSNRGHLRPWRRHSLIASQWEGVFASNLDDGSIAYAADSLKMPETPAARSAMQQLQKDLGLLSTSSSPEFQSCPIFVCIDCEAYERAHHKVTEIGVATLDTRDLLETPAGDGAKNWIQQMRYAHYRLVDHGKLVNRNFVTGRERYFNFGNTTWIAVADARQTLQRIFDDPARIADAAHFNVSVTDQKRNIILVGHGLHNDRAFLSKVGFSVADVPNIVRSVDTDVVGGGSKKKGVSLRRLLISLNINAKNLHNAGNDAAYTLQALISMAWKDYTSPGSTFNDLDNISGKLPPMSYTNNVAPTIWGGTTRPRSSRASKLNSHRGYAKGVRST